MVKLINKIKNYRGSKKTRLYLYFIIYLLVVAYFITLYIYIDLEKEVDEANKRTNEIIVEIGALETQVDVLKSVIKLEEIEVCAKGTAKTYMDYRAITAKNSAQYKYINESGKIKIENGYLMEDDFIGVALGSYFGKIGSKYIFTLDTGKIIKVVKIEAKADAHTNNGCEQKWDGSVIEFVIDSTAFKKSSNGYVYNGNFNNLDRFKGSIIKIEKVQ